MLIIPFVIGISYMFKNGWNQTVITFCIFADLLSWQSAIRPAPPPPHHTPGAPALCLNSFNSFLLTLSSLSNQKSALSSSLCIVSLHCRQYIPPGQRNFPRAGILHSEAWEIVRGKSQGPRVVYFPMHPESRQCTVYNHSLRNSREVLILWCDNGWHWHQSVFWLKYL